SAVVNWSTDEPADGQVEYGPSTQYGNLSPLQSALVTDHTITLGGLVPGQTYHFRVRSRDAAGNLQKSQDFTFTTEAPDVTPPAIANVTTTSTSNGAQIDWDTDEPADSQVEFGPDATYGNVTTLVPDLVNHHSQALSGLNPSTTYHFRVLSRDASGNLATSADTTFTTKPPDKTPPVVVSVQVINVTITQAVVDWTTDEPTVGWVQYGVDTTYGLETPLESVYTTSHETMLDGLGPATQYHFRVVTSDASGNITTSADFTFTTPSAPPPISSSVNLALKQPAVASNTESGSKASNAVDGKTTTFWQSAPRSRSAPAAWLRVDLGSSVVVGRVIIKWERLYYAEGYEIQLSSDGNTWNTVFSTLDGTKSDQQVDFSPTAARYVRLNMTKRHRSSYRVQEFEVYGAGGTVPVAPSALVATAVGPGTIDLSWTDNSDNEDGFKVERSSGGSTFVAVGQVGSGVTVFSDTGLSPQTAYTYRVFAFNGVGNSAFTNQATATTAAPPPPPAAPTSLLASAVDATTIELAWTDNADNEDGFTIERSENGGGFVPFAQVGPDVTNYRDAAVLPGRAYAYRVFAFNSSGNSALSNEAGATAPSGKVVLSDPLSSSTLGVRTGGQFDPSGGWQVTGAQDMIVYDIGRYLTRGCVEINIRNFRPQQQNSAERHHLIAMFRNPYGNHNPIENTEMAWDFHAGTRYRPGIKMLSLQFGNLKQDVVLTDWDKTKSYKLTFVWNDSTFRYYRNDTLQVTHKYGQDFQLRYLFVGRDFTVSSDLITGFNHNQYPALVGPIYSNVTVKDLDLNTDTVAPGILGIAATEQFANGARLSWKTDELAVCYVEYGPDITYGSRTPTLGVPADSFSTVLPALTPGQVYHFRVVATDRAGNQTTSPDQTFTTLDMGHYVFAPTADTYVERSGVFGQTRDNANFGWTSLLLSDGREIYLRFDVTGVLG
ncbi:MAG: hypothetical protein D6743_02025, partial [Calditrichaeota bacterium]